MSAAPITEQELADRLHLTLDEVAKFRRLRGWPHLRFGRFKVRYTEQQVAQIEAMHSSHRASSVAAISGQTPASKRRAS